MDCSIFSELVGGYLLKGCPFIWKKCSDFDNQKAGYSKIYNIFKVIYDKFLKRVEKGGTRGSERGGW